MEDKSLLKKLADPTARGIWRGCAVYLVLATFSLALGIGFFLIFIGLWRLLMVSAPYWEPPFRAMVTIFNFPTVNRNDVKRPLTWWRVILLALNFVVCFFCLYLGIRALIFGGFLNQNLIYLFLK